MEKKKQFAGLVTTRTQSTSFRSWLQTIGGIVWPASKSSESAVPVWQRRYRVVDALGSGGMGTALLAQRLTDSLPVCLKFCTSQQARRMAEQECRSLLRLRHESIVSLLDFCLEDEPPWLVTEMVKGVTLLDYLSIRSRLDLMVVQKILACVLRGLEHAHAQGIVHRDLKPANVIVDVDRGCISATILDFGISLLDEFDFEGHCTALGSVAGTVAYMAPEQLRGEHLSSACDMYAFGLIATEMLDGHSVFEGQTLPQIITAKLHRLESYVVQDAPDSLPVELRSFIESCTSPDPSKRPSASEGCVILGRIGV